MVLFVHGGPWGRDEYGYNSYHQWLANRGYAVLSVNYRASTGFGKNFITAGNLQWGKKMHDDLLDSVDWAVAKGVTTPDKVAILGGSYGGYATLAGITMTPDKFACPHLAAGLIVREAAARVKVGNRGGLPQPRLASVAASGRSVRSS